MPQNHNNKFSIDRPHGECDDAAHWKYNYWIIMSTCCILKYKKRRI